MKRFIFIALTLAVPLLFLFLAVAVFLPRIEAGLRPFLLQHMASNLTAEERKEIYGKIAQGTNFWDATPDPDVGGLGQPNRTVTDAGAEVHINNAGLRAAGAYTPRDPNRFRIICLGDSFVFGMGGPEADRFCNQLEAFYRDHQITPGGKPVEAYAVGLPGWTLRQETTYLAARITDYDPDVIIVLSVANDITDNFGVNGAGALTSSFSPEHRSLGSAVFSNDINLLFGDTGPRAALSADLSPASRERWTRAMERLRRLVELQQQRGKRILVSAMAWGRTDDPDAFPVVFQSHYARLQIPAPFFMTSFLPGKRTMLGHDSHPNRLGHQILRDQYVHALSRLGWVEVPDSVLPHLERGTPVRLDPPLDTARAEDSRRAFLRYLTGTLDFSRLKPEQSRAFLAGVLPESPDPAHATESAPWGSLKTVFLLRRPKGRAVQSVDVEIEIPARPELFPFKLKLSLDGLPASEQTYERPGEETQYRISGVPAGPAFHDGAIEVTLEASSYFSTIDDPRMKSYRLLRATAR